MPAGKFGLDPRDLDDASLERELHYLYEIELAREYASRFPEQTEPDEMRTRRGSRERAGQPKT